MPFLLGLNPYAYGPRDVPSGDARVPPYARGDLLYGARAYDRARASRGERGPPSHTSRASSLL